MRPSIIIPLYNRHDLTVRCLDALADLDAELVLVDNGSTDETADLKVTVRNLENRGFAAACNQGADAATGDVLVFLNNDTEPHPGWLPALMTQLESCTVAGGKLLRPDGTVQHAGIVVDFTKPPGREAEEIPWDLNVGPYRVDAVTGALLAIRRADFPGFDQGYWNGYEDVDLCLTVRARGGECWFTPESVVTHVGHASGPERWSRVAENVRRLRDKWSTHG